MVLTDFYFEISARVLAIPLLAMAGHPCNPMILLIMRRSPSCGEINEKSSFEMIEMTWRGMGVRGNLK